MSRSIGRVGRQGDIPMRALHSRVPGGQGQFRSCTHRRGNSRDTEVREEPMTARPVGLMRMRTRMYLY